MRWNIACLPVKSNFLLYKKTLAKYDCFVLSQDYSSDDYFVHFIRSGGIMRKYWVLSFMGLLYGSLSLAHGEDGPMIVELEANDVKARTAIAQIIHIDSIFENRVYSVVNHQDLQRLKEQKIARILSVEILGERISEYYAPFAVIDFPTADDDFHTYDEMVSEIKSWEKDNPGLVQVFSLGQSVKGKEIWAIKIGEHAQFKDENKKAIAYMGTHHAREHVSTEMPLLFAQELIRRANDPEISSLLKEIDIYLIPMVNPDGAMYDIENRRYKYWRKNRRSNNDSSYGVDLNRNYGYGWGTGGSSSSPSSDIYMGQAAFSEPETQSIKRFFEENRNITIALSFHTFSELILYPWGGQSDGVGGSDERLYKTMAREMAAMNNYRPMQSSELYIASGDTCDWLHGALHVYCFTFELSPSSMSQGGFYPGEAVIPRVFGENLKPMLYLANFAKNPLSVLQGQE